MSGRRPAKLTQIALHSTLADLSHGPADLKGTGARFMKLRPYPLKRAVPFCRRIHRKLHRLQGGMWSVAIQEGIEVRGVGIVGRPNARMLDDGFKLQVIRVAVLEGTPNGCSMLYGACSRAARGMGATDLLTYLAHDESGVSLKAAGWVEDVNCPCEGGEWNCRSRPRRPAEQPGKKRRWWAPWSQTAQKLMQSRVGTHTPAAG